MCDTDTVNQAVSVAGTATEHITLQTQPVTEDQEGLIFVGDGPIHNVYIHVWRSQAECNGVAGTPEPHIG